MVKKEQIDRIKRLEEMTNDNAEWVDKVNEVLDGFEPQVDAYKTLSAYYGSDTHWEDMEADQARLLPEDLPRGILSEDGLYNVLGANYQLGLRFLRLAHALLNEAAEDDLEN